MHCNNNAVCRPETELPDSSTRQKIELALYYISHACTEAVLTYYRAGLMECNPISRHWLGGSVIVLAVTTVGSKSSY
jgi:hypothetical protein